MVDARTRRQQVTEPGRPLDGQQAANIINTELIECGVEADRAGVHLDSEKDREQAFAHGGDVTGAGGVAEFKDGPAVLADQQGRGVPGHRKCGDVDGGHGAPGGG